MSDLREVVSLYLLVDVGNLFVVFMFVGLNYF